MNQIRRPGPVTISQIKSALQELGGEAAWDKILSQVTKNRNGDYSHYLNKHNYENTAFQIIQYHCHSYKKYRGPAHFEKVGNKFRLIGNISSETVGPQLTPIATDIRELSQPERIKQETYRILRDTVLSREVKVANQYRCQICSQTLKLTDGKLYAESHHIKPLGAPHNGPDVRENILCVCPNHHVLLDYGAIKLDEAQLKGIGSKFIDYHNEHIFGKA